MKIEYYELPDDIRGKIDSLLSQVDRDSQDFINKDVKMMASNYALSNIPKHEDASIEPYIEQVRGFFERKNTDITIKLQGAIQHQLATMNIIAAKAEFHACEGQIKKMLDENKRDLMDLQKLELEMDKRSIKKFNNILLALGIAEGVGYTLAFMRIGDSVLMAIVFGGLLGFGQSWGVKLLVLWLSVIAST